MSKVKLNSFEFWTIEFLDLFVVFYNIIPNIFEFWTKHDIYLHQPGLWKLGMQIFFPDFSQCVDHKITG